MQHATCMHPAWHVTVLPLSAGALTSPTMSACARWPARRAASISWRLRFPPAWPLPALPSRAPCCPPPVGGALLLAPRPPGALPPTSSPLLAPCSSSPSLLLMSSSASAMQMLRMARRSTSPGLGTVCSAGAASMVRSACAACATCSSDAPASHCCTTCVIGCSLSSASGTRLTMLAPFCCWPAAGITCSLRPMTLCSAVSAAMKPPAEVATPCRHAPRACQSECLSAIRRNSSGAGRRCLYSCWRCSSGRLHQSSPVFMYRAAPACATVRADTSTAARCTPTCTRMLQGGSAALSSLSSLRSLLVTCSSCCSSCWRGSTACA